VAGQTIMDSVTATIDQATRTAVTARIITHVQRGWPRLGTPRVRFRGQFCYVDAALPGHRQPTPILRLRYQGSADRWDIGIYLASDEALHRIRTPRILRPQDRHPGTRHRSHLHPLRRPQHLALTPSTDPPSDSTPNPCETAKLQH